MHQPLSIDFITTANLSAAEQMYEYFELTPQHQMTDYEPITGGIRAYYEIIQLNLREV